MNNIDKKYQSLLQDILDNGVEKKDRTGTGTISVFGRQIRHKMSEGFPLLTTKKMPWKSIVTELLWFLQGNTNIKWLVDNGCNIWNGDAYKNYKSTTEHPLSMMEFIDTIKNDSLRAKTLGELGPIYGKQWRKWSVLPDKYGAYNRNPIDQIQNLINDLKTNPDSRRLMVNAWNVGELDQMVLPPCHYGFQVYTRELSLEERKKLVGDKTLFALGSAEDSYNEANIPTRAISLMWNQRSVDTFLGLPFNIASYGLLLEIIAKEVNMVPDELIGNLGDTHLYLNHVEQAKEQIGRKYTHEERTELLKQAMGEEHYNKAVDELMPFGGGLSGYYDSYKIPYMTREPYELPRIELTGSWKFLSSSPCFGDTIQHKDINLVDYESHPTIKAPLSN